ncbi:MAG: glycosyltransferase family 2 protein [Propioniciclava sp.]|uniref:glycosyltransferase family 2 protein n=1 Tax=Propioniciclava sp. TaxID=2038686 RepID=UPI0039E36354
MTGSREASPVPDFDPARSSVAVVICAYDDGRWPVLAQAVQAAAGQLGEADELVVVIDHNPGLLTRARDAWEGLPRVRVVPNSGERGLSGGRNTGIEHSSAAVVAFLDDDAVPRPGWVEALRARFADPAVAAVGGAVHPRWAAGTPPRWLPEEFGWVVGCDYRGLPSDGASIRNPIGANMAIARDAFDAVGGFSERLGRTGELPTGCEETELGIRIRAALPGRILVRDTSAAVDHLVPTGRGTVRYFARRCWNEGRSKAALTALVGAGDALSSERGHAFRLVTRAPARYLRRAAGGDPSGVARALFCAVGLAVTGAGYLSGRSSGVSRVTGQDAAPSAPVATSGLADDSSPADVSSPVTASSLATDSSSDPSGFTPIPVIDVDLGTGRGPDVQAPEVQVLVRCHGWPLGQTRVRLDAVPQGIDDWRTLLRDADPALVAAADGLAAPAAATPAASGLGTGTGETVSVVICTLGRNPLLTTTVRAVLAQRGPMDELLVIDNDPGSGGVATLLDGISDPRLRVVAEPRRGASHARNTGAAHARGVLLAFTDDDAVPDPDWTAQLTAALTAHPGIGCATGLVLPAGFESADQLRFEEYGGFAKGYATTHWDPADDPTLDAALTACARAAGSPTDAVPGRRGAAFPYTAGEFGSGVVALRATTFAALGGFDPALGPGTPTHAGEDLDLCRRVYLSGAAVAYHPAAIVRHHHRTDGAQLQEQIFGYGVGLTAALAKLLFTQPRHLAGFAARIPAAANMLFAADSKKNAALPADFPAELLQAERRGMLAGPLRYLRSRAAAR